MEWYNRLNIFPVSLAAYRIYDFYLRSAKKKSCKHGIQIEAILTETQGNII